MSTFACMKPLSTAMLGGMFVLLAGCAGGPVPAGSGAAATQAGTVAAPTAAQAKHLAQVQKLVLQAREAGLPGFYALVRGGREMYCWRDKNVGTLIPTTKCVQSAAELRQVLSAMAEQRHRLEEAPQGACSSGGACSGN